LLNLFFLTDILLRLVEEFILQKLALEYFVQI
jgi:hypothetical protein